MGSLAGAEIPDGTVWKVPREGRLCKDLETGGRARRCLGRGVPAEPAGGGLRLVCCACTCVNSQEGIWVMWSGQEGEGEEGSQQTLRPAVTFKAQHIKSAFQHYKLKII